MGGGAQAGNPMIIAATMTEITTVLKVVNLFSPKSVLFISLASFSKAVLESEAVYGYPQFEPRRRCRSHQSWLAAKRAEFNTNGVAFHLLSNLALGITTHQLRITVGR